MRPYYVLCLLVLSLILILNSSGTAAPTTPAPIKRVLTKINATSASGLSLELTSNKLELTDISGDSAATFPVDPDSLSITPTVSVQYTTQQHVRKYISAKQVWLLTDATGEGVKLLNNTLRSLIIVSSIDRTLTLRCGAQSFHVPAHSLFLFNNPPQRVVLDFGDNWTAFYGSYKQTLSPIDSPTLVVVSDNQEGIPNGLPEIVEGKIFDQSLSLESS